MSLKYFRYLAYIIEILVFFAIQQTPFLIPSIMGARPTLVISIFVSIIIFETELAAVGFGVFIGLLMDFGMGSVLGINAIILAVCGYFIGVLVQDLIKINFFTASIFFVSVMFLVFILQFFLCYFIHDYGNNQYFIINHYLPRIVYSLLVWPIFYLFNKSVVMHIREKES